MELKRYKYIPEVQANVELGRLHLSGPTLYESQEEPNTEIFTCGRGSKAAGFSPHQWVFRQDCKWWVRTPGTSGQRGQMLIRGGVWSTQVYEPTAEQQTMLDNATIS